MGACSSSVLAIAVRCFCPPERVTPRFQLDKSVGIIDSDYARSDNEGHIFMRMTNDNREGKSLLVPAGTAFAQGIFLPFGITVDDDAQGVRNGGLGSTTGH